MTTDTFIKRIEGYYGVQYRPVQRPFITQYLELRDERALDHLFGLVIKTFSSQYGKVPDIAVFEDLRNEVIQSLKDERSQQIALPLPSDTISEEARAEVQKGLAMINAMLGTKIPEDAWGDT